MLNFLPSFSKLWSNKKQVLLLLFIICVFISLAIYYYITIVQPKLNKKYVANKEFLPEADSEHDIIQKHATLYFFYTNWCPHCKKAKPEWESLKNETNGIVKGVNIAFKDVDCDQEAELADEYKVEGYPTIKLVYDNKIYDYDAKPDKATLIQFLNSVL